MKISPKMTPRPVLPTEPEVGKAVGIGVDEAEVGVGVGVVPGL